MSVAILVQAETSTVEVFQFTTMPSRRKSVELAPDQMTKVLNAIPGTAWRINDDTGYQLFMKYPYKDFGRAPDWERMKKLQNACVFGSHGR